MVGMTWVRSASSAISVRWCHANMGIVSLCMCMPPLSREGGTFVHAYDVLFIGQVISGSFYHCPCGDGQCECGWGWINWYIHYNSEWLILANRVYLMARVALKELLERIRWYWLICDTSLLQSYHISKWSLRQPFRISCSVYTINPVEWIGLLSAITLEILHSYLVDLVVYYCRSTQVIVHLTIVP